MLPPRDGLTWRLPVAVDAVLSRRTRRALHTAPRPARPAPTQEVFVRAVTSAGTARGAHAVARGRRGRASGLQVLAHRTRRAVRRRRRRRRRRRHPTTTAAAAPPLAAARRARLLRCRAAPVRAQPPARAARGGSAPWQRPPLARGPAHQQTHRRCGLGIGVTDAGRLRRHVPEFVGTPAASVDGGLRLWLGTCRDCNVIGARAVHLLPEGCRAAAQRAWRRGRAPRATAPRSHSSC